MHFDFYRLNTRRIDWDKMSTEELRARHELILGEKGLWIMFGGRINFEVMLCPQYFYNKSYAKSCYW